MGFELNGFGIAFAILVPLLCIAGCIALAYYIMKGRKKRVGPHISIATKSAVPPHRAPPPPPPPPPQTAQAPPHMVNGGIYRSHETSTDPYLPYPSSPLQSQQQVPSYTVHQPPYGYNSDGPYPA